VYIIEMAEGRSVDNNVLSVTDCNVHARKLSEQFSVS
jgi:hypothetical protein